MRECPYRMNLNPTVRACIKEGCVAHEVKMDEVYIMLKPGFYG